MVFNSFSRKNIPKILEINTISWLYDLSKKFNRPIKLDTIPENIIDEISRNFDGIWLMGVWTRSQRSKDLSIYWENLNHNYAKVLPDINYEEDIIGSAYAIADYKINPMIGDFNGLKKFKNKLNEQNKILLLDFVPNHTAVDHWWVKKHPEYYFHGTEEDLDFNRNVFLKIGKKIFAHGKDPFFPPWTDTLQMNPFSEKYRTKVINLLTEFSKYCDGVRCDMAMLLVDSIFLKNWGFITYKPLSNEFWVEIIHKVKEQSPNFIFLAEVYWNMQEELIKQGFDYCYDKEFYDALFQNNQEEIRKRLKKPVNYQNHLLRFLENHDERRSMVAFGKERSLAAAILTFTTPGSKLVYNGQSTGYEITIPVQVKRQPEEDTNNEILNFYTKFFSVLNEYYSKGKDWQLIDVEIEEYIQPETGIKEHSQVISGGSAKFTVHGTTPLQISISPMIAHIWKCKQYIILTWVNFSDKERNGAIKTGIIFPKKKQGESLNIFDLITNNDDSILSEQSKWEQIMITLPPWGFKILKITL